MSGTRSRDYRKLAVGIGLSAILLAGLAGGVATISTRGLASPDPASATFSYTSGSLNTARIRHTATLLTDGLVLMAGGEDAGGNPLASAELYNPATQTFT